MKYFAAGIVERNKCILLVKKGDYYFLPGGKVEYNETVRQALKREIKEETNLDVECLNKVFESETSKWKGYYFNARCENSLQEIVNMEPDKHSECEWFHNLPKNINHLDNIAIQRYYATDNIKQYLLNIESGVIDASKLQNMCTEIDTLIGEGILTFIEYESQGKLRQIYLIGRLRQFKTVENE